MTPSILIDSADPKFIYTGKQWQSGFDPSTQGGSFNSCHTVPLTSTTVAPTMTLSFQGSAIQFFGQPGDDFKMNYTYDGSRPREADMNFQEGISGKTGIRLWSIENVTSTSHYISLIPTDGSPIFDYAVVTPTSSTSLSGQILVLDDTDSLIKYNSGGWISDSGTRYSGGISFNDTKRGTNKKGDTFSVAFVGASISVYGLLNQQSGTLSSTYSIDGATPTTFIAYNGTQQSATSVWSLHQQFFHKEVIPGNHTLVVTVGEVTGNQMFWLDYVTFEGTSSTRLTPLAPQNSSSKSSLTKLIGGLVAAAIVLIILFSLLKARYGRRVKAWWYAEPPQSPVIVEVPTRPTLLHQPSHLNLTSPALTPALYQLQRDVDALRWENERIRTFTPPQFHPPPPPFQNNNSFHVRVPPAPLPPGPPHPTSPGFRESSNNHLGYASEVSTPASQVPLMSTPTPLQPSPPPFQRDGDNSAALQQEIVRLREENERMRTQRAAVPQPAGIDAGPADEDAGPADAPPPYNDANYIP